MIVTRQRRKPFPWRRLILPLIAIALVVFAFSWGPSRNVITGGPMGPLWNTVGSTFDKVATPFHFAAQNQLITDRNKQILALQNQITDLQNHPAPSIVGNFVSHYETGAGTPFNAYALLGVLQNIDALADCFSYVDPTNNQKRFYRRLDRR